MSTFEVSSLTPRKINDISSCHSLMSREEENDVSEHSSKILTYPNQALRTISENVTKYDNNLRTFVEDLENTMKVEPGGVGIAAPQVGKCIRVVVIDLSIKPNISHHGRLVLINPEIKKWKGTSVGREGCMSLPDYTGKVMRAERITLDAFDEYGEKNNYIMDGYEARVVQHELDHLEGVLFIDRLVSKTKDLYLR